MMRALELIGSDVENFECPRCGCHDRERHLFLFMQSLGILMRLSEMRVLHFAPERRLGEIIGQAEPAEYVRCDLMPSSPNILAVNIEQMPFGSQSFDLVIANHVLEHVRDDKEAIREIARVLAPACCGILQTPFSPVLKQTWSDPGISSEQARLQCYGQEDHVRLYGRDIFERFEACGLIADVRHSDDMLPTIDARQAGINRLEPFMLFRLAV